VGKIFWQTNLLFSSRNPWKGRYGGDGEPINIECRRGVDGGVFVKTDMAAVASGWWKVTLAKA
jgi:hypothetical protein